MITTTPEYDTANLNRSKQPIFRVVIDTYSREFTGYNTGVTGQYPWMENLGNQGITVSDMEGGAELGQLSITVFDIAGGITADMPGFVFEGKTIRLYTGFVGLAQAKFMLMFTGQIDNVISSDTNNAYTFVCSDNKKALTRIVYKTGDDGFPTSSDHPKTINGHPLDILLDILQNQIGYSLSEANIAKIAAYRNGIFASWQFFFTLESPPAAKDFIEKQIMQPLGGYIWPNNKGQIDVNFFYRDNRLAAASYAMIGGFIDGSGLLVGIPFPIRLSNGGESISLVVPPAAVSLTLGASDHFWTDNIGAWNVTVNATPLAVSGQARPWNSSTNPDLTFTETGSISPVTTAVTPGATIVITYINGTVQNGVGFPFVPPIGDPDGLQADPLGPGFYARTPFAPSASQFSLNATNLAGDLPLVQQAPFVNTVSFRFDKNTDGKYMSELIAEDDDSIAKYDLSQQTVIESDGMRSGFQGFFSATFVARTIFQRYADKPLLIEGLVVNWSACKLEPGDVVDVTLTLFPDRIAGVRGVTAKLFEVLDREYDYNNHRVTLKLLDATYLSKYGSYLIARATQSNYTSATAAEKALYMFQANASDQYSNGDPAHILD